MTHAFTGRHMWLVMLGFFGTVVAVNFGMAWVAGASFSGTVVDNSYVASQQFNGWLQAARSQRRLGWTVAPALDARRHVVLADSRAGDTVVGLALHPLGRAPDMVLHFALAVDGHLRSRETLPAGRWQVRLTVRRAGETARLAADVK
jgi:nitrogen fixation protein FixH